MFDRTGALALYMGGSGVDKENVLSPGTHFTGIYDHVVVVNCKDAHTREEVSVLTKSDINVVVDIRLTYAADCENKERLSRIFDQVTIGPDGSIDPERLYDLYVLPIVRESLRNRLSNVTIEDVKSVREDVRDQIMKDLEESIDGDKRPVLIKLVAVSDIKLPQQIVEKNQQIELARQEAEQEREKQEAAKYRLERELFEAQQDRKVQNELAERAKDVQLIGAQRDKEVAILEAEAKLEARKREAQGIKEIRAQLTKPYIDYLRVSYEKETRIATAAAMKEGTVWYVGKDFLVAPGSPITVSGNKGK